VYFLGGARAAFRGEQHQIGDGEVAAFEHLEELDAYGAGGADDGDLHWIQLLSPRGIP
jgi:hypothetical protein